MTGIDNAKKQARKLLAKYGSPNKPTDVEHIADELGIKIVPYPFSDEGQDGISGVFFKQGKRLFLGVRSDDHNHRKRFTIAHEIGHYTLHSEDMLHYDRAEIYPEYVFYRQSGTIPTSEEREANFFAAELLMPQELVETCIGKGMNTIEQLADFFDVSEQAMTIRLTYLGYL